MPASLAGIPPDKSALSPHTAHSAVPVAVDVLVSRNGNSHAGVFDPTLPPHAAAIRALASRVFRQQPALPLAASTDFVRYVLDQQIKDPWILAYTLGIAWWTSRDPALVHEVEAAVRSARESWPELLAQQAFSTDARLQQRVLESLDDVRPHLVRRFA